MRKRNATLESGLGKFILERGAGVTWLNGLSLERAAE